MVEPGKIQKLVGRENELSSKLSQQRRKTSGSKFSECIRDWNLISSGPSMMKVKPEDLLPGGMTVAINRALSIRNRVPVDIWAVWDHPNRLFNLGYGKHLYPPLTIWLGTNRFHEFYLADIGMVDEPTWEHELHPLIGLRSMPWGFRPTPGKDLEGKDCTVAKTAFTLIYAIEKAVTLGAKHIRIFGADMAGSWSPGKTEEECVAKWGDRWEWERDQLEGCIRAADAEEVFIEHL